MKIESPDEPQAAFDHFFAKTPIPYTCEWKEVDRQLKILMKSELNRINCKITSKEEIYCHYAQYFTVEIDITYSLCFLVLVRN